MTKSLWAALVVLFVGLGAAFLFSRKDKSPDPEKADVSREEQFLIRPSPSPSADSHLNSGGAAPEARKVRILEEIFASKNDNDPRLDQEFNHLTPTEKALFRARYSDLPMEKRNERGTIVFLLGRNPEGRADFDFLCEVLREPPCRSLKDCSKDATAREEFDRESGEEITLSYPQLVALKSLERFFGRKDQGTALRRAAVQSLDCALESKAEIVVEKARALTSSISD